MQNFVEKDNDKTNKIEHADLEMQLSSLITPMERKITTKISYNSNKKSLHAETYLDLP